MGRRGGQRKAGSEGPMPDLALDFGWLRFHPESLARQRDNCLPRAIWGTGQRGGEAVKDSLTRTDESWGGGAGLQPACHPVCV